LVKREANISASDIPVGERDIGLFIPIWKRSKSFSQYAWSHSLSFISLIPLQIHFTTGRD
jgi:hypothetical protein